MGPKANTGAKVSTHTRIMVLTRKRINKGVWVGSVPEDGGMVFLLAKEPAIARTGTIIQ